MATFKQYTKKNGDKAWSFRAYLGMDYVTGQEIRVDRQGFPTKKAAQLELNKIINDFESGDYDAESKKDTKFEELYQIWFELYKTTVKENTWMQTDRRMKKYILPTFGNMYVERINLKKAQLTVNKWAKQFGMYIKLLSYVRRVMDHAVTLELIDSNPFRKITNPKAIANNSKKHVLKYYNKEQLQIFFKTIDQRSNSIASNSSLGKYYAELDRALFRLLAFSGIRIGEGIALLWSDIDLEQGQISINKTVSDKTKGFLITTPKTVNSYRTINIDQTTITILRSWKLLQKKHYLKYGIKTNSIVFANKDGNYMQRTNIYNRSNKIALQAGLDKIGNHGFRHTHASLLFSSGVSPKKVQERLGHSSISITLDIYTHISEAEHKITVDQLVSYVGF